jgi:hypothetical protein
MIRLITDKTQRRASDKTIPLNDLGTPPLDRRTDVDQSASGAAGRGESFKVIKLELYPDTTRTC